MKKYIRTGRLDNITNWQTRESQKKVDSENARNQEVESLKQRVKALKPRIDELIETANAAQNAGIKIKNTSMSANYYPEYAFDTDGWFHKLGFYMGYGYGNPIKYIGIMNGGACGNYDFLTDGNVVCGVEHGNSNGKKVPDYKNFSRDAEAFLSKFDAFEKRFYDYIDKLTAE